MALLDLQKLTAGLSQTWAGFLRDWDRPLRSGNFPWFATRRAPGIPGPDPAPFIAVRHNERDETQHPAIGQSISRLSPYPAAAPPRHRAATAAQPTALSRTLRKSL
jgi:hypothetical protein